MPSCLNLPKEICEQKYKLYFFIVYLYFFLVFLLLCGVTLLKF